MCFTNTWLSPGKGIPFFRRFLNYQKLYNSGGTATFIKKGLRFDSLSNINLLLIERVFEGVLYSLSLKLHTCTSSFGVTR